MGVRTFHYLYVWVSDSFFNLNLYWDSNRKYNNLFYFKLIFIAIILWIALILHRGIMWNCFALYLCTTMNTWNKKGAFEKILNVIKGWEWFWKCYCVLRISELFCHHFYENLCYFSCYKIIILTYLFCCYRRWFELEIV